VSPDIDYNFDDLCVILAGTVRLTGLRRRPVVDLIEPADTFLITRFQGMGETVETGAGNSKRVLQTA